MEMLSPANSATTPEAAELEELAGPVELPEEGDEAPQAGPKRRRNPARAGRRKGFEKDRFMRFAP